MIQRLRLPQPRRILVFALLGLGYAYFALTNGLFLRWDYTVDLINLVLLGILVPAYLLVRHRVGLPKTGIEIPALICMLVILGTIAFSPDPRLGLERYTLLLNLGLLFYLLLDAFGAGLSLRAVFCIVMAVSGLIAAAAAAEIYAWYLGWSSATGGSIVDAASIYRILTLTGHSNVYMGYMNFLAPLVVIFGLTSKSRLASFATTLWMAFFLITIPFTSSRSGVVELAAWAGVLALLWARDARLWDRLKRWGGARRGLLIGLGGLVGLLVLAAGYAALAWFARHPTHGVNTAIFSGREGLWATAQTIWLQSPWVGVGLNRYAFAYVLTTRAYPTAFWALNAHSTVLNLLAETGLAGFLSLLIPSGLFLWKAWQAYRRLPPSKKLWGAAILAGLVSGLVYAITESVFDNLYLVTAVVIFGAWLLAQGEMPRISPNFISMPILGLPLLASTAILAILLWSYQPFSAGVQAYESGNKEVGLALLQTAEERDPGIALYQNQVALALADRWGMDGSAASLQQARAEMAAFLEREPSLSLWWADLAVLDWYAGDPADALTRMAKAEDMAPGEATYPLNLGWFEEQSGSPVKALADYRQALTLDPEWSCHPFWRGSELRRSAVLGIDCTRPWSGIESAPNFAQAASLIAAGKLPQADAAIQAGHIAGESDLIYRTMQAAYYAAAGQAALATQARQELLAILERRTLREWREPSALYMAPYARQSLSLEIVPGYLKLAPDVGQFEQLELLAEEDQANGQSGAAASVRAVLARWKLGGEIAP